MGHFVKPLLTLDLRDHPRFLRLDQRAAAKSLEKRKRQYMAMRLEGDIRHPSLFKKTHQLASDYSVAMVITKELHHLARYCRPWTVDRNPVMVQIKNNEPSARQASKLCEGNSRFSASPTTISVGKPSDRLRASATITWLLSSPTTLPVFPTKRAISITSPPTPHPMSRIRWPVRTPKTSSISRLPCRTDSIEPISSRNWIKYCASAAWSTSRKPCTVSFIVMPLAGRQDDSLRRWSAPSRCRTGSRPQDSQRYNHIGSDSTVVDGVCRCRNENRSNV